MQEGQRWVASKPSPSTMMDLVSDTTKENQSYKAPNVNPLKRHKGISHDGIMNANKTMDFPARRRNKDVMEVVHNTAKDKNENTRIAY
jgi:hypothetical protein